MSEKQQAQHVEKGNNEEMDISAQEITDILNLADKNYYLNLYQSLRQYDDKSGKSSVDLIRLEALDNTGLNIIKHLRWFENEVSPIEKRNYEIKHQIPGMFQMKVISDTKVLLCNVEGELVEHNFRIEAGEFTDYPKEISDHCRCFSSFLGRALYANREGEVRVQVPGGTEEIVSEIYADSLETTPKNEIIISTSFGQIRTHARLSSNNWSYYIKIDSQDPRPDGKVQKIQNEQTFYKNNNLVIIQRLVGNNTFNRIDLEHDEKVVDFQAMSDSSIVVALENGKIFRWYESTKDHWQKKMVYDLEGEPIYSMQAVSNSKILIGRASSVDVLREEKGNLVRDYQIPVPTGRGVTNIHTTESGRLFCTSFSDFYIFDGEENGNK